LRYVAGIAGTTNGGKHDQATQVSTLLMHGPFQAAYFVDNGIAFGSTDKRWYNRGHQGSPQNDNTASEGVLEEIGVWYDFACLPQKIEGSQRLMNSLMQIHELIGESTMLVLRYPGDSYDTRAWCASEIAVESDIQRDPCRKIVLRLDKLGKPIRMEELTESNGSEYNTGARRIIAKPLEEWPKPTSRPLSRVSELYRMFLPELEEDRDFPLLTTRLKPEMFRGQRTLLLAMIEKLTTLSDRDASSPLREDNRLGVDIKDSVQSAMQEAGLKCKNPHDLVYTGFLILYSRHRGAPEMAAFYGQCMVRWVEGRSTTLTRYREKREFHNIRVWYIFDDETLKLPSEGPPVWTD
jgi:hypothetical protein